MPYNPYNHSRDTWGPFRHRPGYHPADPANWWYTPEEFAALKIDREFEAVRSRARSLAEAKQALQALRGGDDPKHDNQLWMIRWYLERRKFSPETLGTTKEELASFERPKT
jgi:hypothetical protein